MALPSKKASTRRIRKGGRIISIARNRTIREAIKTAARIEGRARGTKKAAESRTHPSLAERLRLTLMAEWLELRIVTIDPCVYHANLGGWIQPTPPQSG